MVRQMVLGALLTAEHSLTSKKGQVGEQQEDIIFCTTAPSTGEKCQLICALNIGTNFAVRTVNQERG